MSNEQYQPDEPERRRNLWNIAYPVTIIAGAVSLPIWSTYYFAKNDPGDLQEMAVVGAWAGFMVVGAAQIVAATYRWYQNSRARSDK